MSGRRLSRGLQPQALIIAATLLLFVAAPQVFGFSLRSSSINEARLATEVQQPSINLRDFGAVGDGITDAGPALQRALDTLAAAGGTLIVPAGQYALLTPVSKDFSGTGYSMVLQGETSLTPIDVAGNGSGLDLTSRLLIRVGANKDAIKISGVKQFIIRDISFEGDPSANADARVVLQFSDVRDARIEHCEFYGLASLVDGGALVLNHDSGLRIQATAFLGCAANSGLYTSVIQNIGWESIDVWDTKFVDYGERPNFFSKTPLGSPLSWVSIGNAKALDTTSSRRQSTIRHVFMDEGAFLQISALPYRYDTVPSASFDVSLSRIWMNVNNLASSGVYLYGVQRVFIERSHFGWSHNADSAINLLNVGEAILDQVECVDHADTIRANSGTGRLTVINSTYQTLDSAAPYTRVVNTPDPNDDPVQYVRQQYLNLVTKEPPADELYDWADRILRCEQNSACISEKQSDLQKYLSSNFPVTNTAPRLLKDESTGEAAALDSVNLLRGPFSLFSDENFSSDGRSRVMLFATNMQGADRTVVTAQAENEQNLTYTLPVEFVGPVPNIGGISQIVIRLTDNLVSGEIVRVSISVRGVASNKVLLRIQ